MPMQAGKIWTVLVLVILGTQHLGKVGLPSPSYALTDVPSAATELEVRQLRLHVCRDLLRQVTVTSAS